MASHVCFYLLVHFHKLIRHQVGLWAILVYCYYSSPVLVSILMALLTGRAGFGSSLDGLVCSRHFPISDLSTSASSGRTVTIVAMSEPCQIRRILGHPHPLLPRQTETLLKIMFWSVIITLINLLAPRDPDADQSYLPGQRLCWSVFR